AFQPVSLENYPRLLIGTASFPTAAAGSYRAAHGTAFPAVLERGVVAIIVCGEENIASVIAEQLQ
ncbi:hypothetical protein ACFFYR_00525, partial [Paraburkholderia dipogonis]|uniref:hypothetical protein n=1 Tax=Paraburkholderia dipogonis TaxID=1211383 RepID=UPI0035E7872A